MPAMMSVRRIAAGALSLTATVSSMANDLAPASICCVVELASATVTAVTPVKVLRLFRRTLVGALKEEPRLAIKLLDGMAARIRQVERSVP